MYNYDYNPEEFSPQDIAKDLGLRIGDSKRSFYLDTKLVGFLVRDGLIRFREGVIGKIKAKVWED